MSENQIRNTVEAALLAAGRSLTLSELSQLFEDGERPSPTDIRAAIEALSQAYTDRPIEIHETNAGFRIQVRRQYAAAVARLWPERPQRYSRALLETLSLIAYRQPITRGEIEQIRGVAVSTNIVKTLEEREWVRVVGYRDVPGKPALFGTTRGFLDYFNLKSLDELPPLAEVREIEDFDPQLTLAPVAPPASSDNVENDAFSTEVPADTAETAASISHPAAEGDENIGAASSDDAAPEHSA